MIGLLISKQLGDLSDKNAVLQWRRNPYYQYFCGMTEYQPVPPCDPANLVHIAKGKEHKKCEYGTKASLVNTMKSNAIIGVCIHYRGWVF